MTRGEVLALVGGGTLLAAGGAALWYFSQNRSTTTPSTPSASASGGSSSSGTLPTLKVAPLTLPSYVRRRCGTAYVSFGLSPANAQYVMVGEYTDGQLVAQYYQLASVAGSFQTAGSWVGGDACAGSGSGSSQFCQTTFTVQAYTGGTSAQAGTLSGIAAKFNTTVQAIIDANIAKYPTISANYIQPGWTLCIPS